MAERNTNAFRYHTEKCLLTCLILFGWFGFVFFPLLGPSTSHLKSAFINTSWMHLPSWRMRLSVSPEGFFFCKTQRYRKEISIIMSVWQMMQRNDLTNAPQAGSGEILGQNPGVSVQAWTGENLVEQLQLDLGLLSPAHCGQVVFPL